MSAAATPDAPLCRWALLIEYDGAPFVGWQRQATGLSVQAVVEAAASHLRGGAHVASIVAGRTDSGVHAAGQVAQMELPATLSAERVEAALNYHLKPHPVAVLRAVRVPDGWSARFSARARAYRYVILDRAARPALAAGRVWHVKQHLEVPAMAAAARLLLGRHDFTSFRASACQANSPVRTMDRLAVWREADRVIVEAEARSFLHHQVRNIVGSLRLVGDGSWPPERLAQALAARDRAAAGPTAPACGLILQRVHYEPDPFTPAPTPAPDRGGNDPAEAPEG